MGEIDDLTREKLREWQMRRLEVKTQMQDQPERTLELSRVLDLMDEEHAAILAASTVFNAAEETAQPLAVQDQPVITESVAGQYDLQLHASAQNPEHLRKLLEMALYEVQAQIDAGRWPAALNDVACPARSAATPSNCGSAASPAVRETCRSPMKCTMRMTRTDLVLY